jgi:hypothetical protein
VLGEEEERGRREKGRKRRESERARERESERARERERKEGRDRERMKVRKQKETRHSKKQQAARNTTHLPDRTYSLLSIISVSLGDRTEHQMSTGRSFLFVPA